MKQSIIKAIMKQSSERINRPTVHDSVFSSGQGKALAALGWDWNHLSVMRIINKNLMVVITLMTEL